MTSFLVVLDHDECITLVSVEPRQSNGSVVQRPGTRHSLTVGTSGIANQSSLSDEDLSLALPDGHIRTDAMEACCLGFATSHGEVIPGVSSVSVPLRIHGPPPAAISVVYISTDEEPAAFGRRLAAAAAAITRELA